MPTNTAMPMRGLVVKIFEDTTQGKYGLEIHDAVGSGNVLVALRYDDAHLEDFRLRLRQTLKGIL